MHYHSTNNSTLKVSFKEAVLKGLAEDRGLFMPNYIPLIQKDIIDNLDNLSFNEIAFIISKLFIEDEIPDSELHNIVDNSISFHSPLVSLSEHISVLELFHGPTLAFKDFGARFMARVMEYFISNSSEKLNILVATSGDTGSAVANGFWGVDGINVIVLFPEGKISKIQEKQITTLGRNIVSIGIEGTFDDCQRLVKSAFTDRDLTSRINLSSANSINIARLIPQSFYYFESFKSIANKDNVLYSVPSGNLGNLTAGLFAKNMGLPIKKFIAANNINNAFTEYINTEKFNPRKSFETISNAMDVGDPSNISRIMDLYDKDHNKISDIIFSKSFSDEETLNAMREIKASSDYVIDPHGAVGYLALQDYLSEFKDDYEGVVLETAHPAKFMDVYANELEFKPDIPKRLARSLSKGSNYMKLSSAYKEFKEFLLG